MLRIYDTIRKGWISAGVKTRDESNEWYLPFKSRGILGAESRSMYDPYIGAGTVWQRDVRGSNMPIHPKSAQWAQWLWDKSPTPWYTGSVAPWGSRTGINTSVFGTIPIAAYIVDSSVPGCNFQYMDSCGAVINQSIMTGAIPWPKHAIPAQNGDRGMAIYDRGTGIMREYCMVRGVEGYMDENQNSTNRHWRAASGGWSVNRPGLFNLSSDNYGTQCQEGRSAVVGMHVPLGFIGIQEIRRGYIDHALAVTAANLSKLDNINESASWPATGSDGKAPIEEDTLVHGQWMRLPDSVDPNFNPRTGKPYNAMTRKYLIPAAKRYGLVFTDTNAWAHAFNGECGYTEKALYGIDPWSDEGDLKTIIDPLDPPNALSCNDFPWDLVEVAAKDWGRPNPDWILRGNFLPWQG